MDKRERLEKTIAAEVTDRVPAALWRHWPGDDQRAADLAAAVVDFQRRYDWDFVRVLPSANCCITDYGVQDEWRGEIHGQRAVIRPVVHRSLDWTELRTLDPARGETGKYVEALRLICEALEADNVPIVQTIYSPLYQAARVAGPELVIRNMRTHPDRLRTGLNIITESTLRLIESTRRLPLAGIFYVCEHASYDTLSEAEYQSFGMPYDRKILESLPERWWFNALELRGSAPMLQLLSEYPVQVINWQDREARPSLSRARSMCNNVVCGGLGPWQHLLKGTPATIRDVAREAIEQTHKRRFILSTGGPILATTPLSNIRAVREAVESILI